MKTTLIALATVIGMSGAAFAMDASDKSTTTPVVAQSDTTLTGSISSSHAITAEEGYASKAGIDVNPNFLPGL